MTTTFHQLRTAKPKKAARSGFRNAEVLGGAISFVLIAGTVATARFRTRDFSFESYSQLQNERVEAYASIVADTERLIPSISQAKPADIRSLANRWSQESASGRLPLLTAAYCDDTVESNAKREIFEASAAITNAANALAKNDALQGNWDLSTKDAVLAIRNATLTRRFDSVSILQGNQLAAITLDTLQQVLPRASKPVRRYALDAILAAPLPSSELTSVAVRTRKLWVMQEVLKADSAGGTSASAQYLPVSTLRDSDLERSSCQLKLATKMESDVDRSDLCARLATDYRSTYNLSRRVERIRRTAV